MLLAIAADDPHLDQLLRLPSLTDPKTGAPMRVSRERMLSMTWVRVSPPTDHASPAYSLAIQIPDPEPVAAPAPP